MNKPGFFESQAIKLLASSPVTIDGPKAWDPQVKVTGAAREALFRRIMTQKSLGLAETYMEKLWDCEDLAGLYEQALLYLPQSAPGITESIIKLQDSFINRQTKSRSKKVGELHYDIPLELYTHMLGTSGLYTCAYYKDGNTDLTKAQTDKIEMVSRKLKLQPGMSVLDIGCGWGGVGKLLVQNTPGIKYIGISISQEQIAAAKKEFADNPDMEFHLMDYRDFNGSVDAVFSMGMIEHVGVKNLPTLFTKIHDVLTPGGRALLHFMHGIAPESNDPFYDLYIFPNSQLPTMDQVRAAFNGKLLGLDTHEIGRMYSPTLDAWDENFIAWWDTLTDEYKANTFGVLFPTFWSDIALHKTPTETLLQTLLLRAERFYRMWRIYLASASGASRAQRFMLYQHLLVRAEDGMPLEQPER